MLESTEKGGVRNSIRNCLTVFQNDPLLSGAIAKNLLTERTDIIKPIGYNRTGTAITDTDMNYLLLYLEETYGLTSEKKIAAAIGIVANENGYHPIRDYLNGLSWDGTERIRTCLHHFLGADSDPYTDEALRLFLLGAIHRAFHPGLFCQISPIFRVKLHRIKRLLQIHVIPVIFIIRNYRVPLNPIYIFRANCPRLAIPFLTIRSPMHEKTEFQILPLFQFHLYRRVLLLIIFHTFVLGL